MTLTQETVAPHHTSLTQSFRVGLIVFYQIRNSFRESCQLGYDGQYEILVQSAFRANNTRTKLDTISHVVRRCRYLTLHHSYAVHHICSRRPSTMTIHQCWMFPKAMSIKTGHFDLPYSNESSTQCIFQNYYLITAHDGITLCRKICDTKTHGPTVHCAENSDHSL